jgi:hypothetical protein
MTSRVYYGLELNPLYVDVIVRRWQVFTGARQCIKPPVNPSTSAPAGRTTISQEWHMARKPFVVTDAVRERVRTLAGLGVPQVDIARIIRGDPKTLRKHFRDELDRGVAEANAVIAGALFTAAKGGNVPAQKFWLKTRGHWHERNVSEDPIPNAGAQSTSQVVLLLPDNNRDPQLTEVLRKAQEKYYAQKKRR